MQFFDAGGMASPGKIPNAKLQIPNKFQFSNDQEAFLQFRIWTIGSYLLFGACYLVLPLLTHAFVALLRRIHF